MKHNNVTNAITGFLEELDLGVSIAEISKDSKQWCESISEGIKECQMTNWNLI